MFTAAAERRTTIERAKSIVDGATNQGRELTAAESADVEAAIAMVHQLDARGKGGDLARKVLSLGGHDQVHDPEKGGGLFSAEAKAGIVYAAKTRTAFRTDLDSKALLTTGAMLPPSGTDVEPGLHPNAQFPISSLFPNQPAEGPVQRYYRTTSGTAAVVAEGGLKPDAGVVFTPVDLALSKLACTANFSDEMATDAAHLVDYLSLELQAAVAAAENKLILDTFGATSGVLTATGALTTVVDLVADAIASMEAISGITPPRSSPTRR